MEKKPLKATLDKDFKAIGESLRQRRKEMNLSFQEVENALSIRTVHLQALEDGELNKLNSPIYAQGFFRQYTSFLGIDGDAIIKDHPQFFTPSPHVNVSYEMDNLEVRQNPGAGLKWFPGIGWVIGFITVSYLAWYFAKWLGVL